MSNKAPEYPDEVETIKTPLTVEPTTVKSLLINPISYNIINLTIKLLRTVEQLIPEDRDTDRIIKTLLTVLNSQHGKPVLEHLLEYGAYTYREMELKLGVPKSTIHYVTSKLIYLKLVAAKSMVLPFYPKASGARPIVWVLEGAPPEFAVNCIKRYYGLTTTERIEVMEEWQSDVIRETLEHFKSKHRIGRNAPPQLEVATYIIAEYPDVEGQQRIRISNKIVNMLYKIKRDMRSESGR